MSSQSNRTDLVVILSLQYDGPVILITSLPLHLLINFDIFAPGNVDES